MVRCLVSDFFNPFNFCEMKKAILRPISAAPTVSFQSTSKRTGKIIFNPTKHIMCLVCLDIDGYWKMQSGSFGAGLIESGHMKLICYKIDEMNQGFDDELAAYFDSLPKEIDRVVQDEEMPF